METITYKCPNCDGGLVFDPDKQKFKCEYCLSDFTEDELKKLQPLVQETETGGGEIRRNQDEPDLALYSCPSCGAEIVTDETTASTCCYYCHNPVVLAGKLEGEYRPDYVAPFELDRKKAEEIFKSWIGKKRFVPKDFYSSRQLELLEGIYYPYWAFQCKVEGKIEAVAGKKRISRTGSIEYTETSQFQVQREGTMEISHVARNALKKADRRLSEAVLPFNMEKLKTFQNGYLSGFKAERRDRELTEFVEEVEAEIKGFAETALKNSITGYDTVSVNRHEERIVNPSWSYCLLPVWILTYKRQSDNKIYYFAMNGQSGKVCGVLPVSFGRLGVLFISIFVPLLLLFLIGGYFI